MGLIAVAGDLSTTTTVALGASWIGPNDPLLVEADPSGGDLAAWFDLPSQPSLSTVVSQPLHDGWEAIDSSCHRADNGLRVIPAPVRAEEAAQAVRAASTTVVSTLASSPDDTAIVDTGRLMASPSPHPFLAAASTLVLVHRQSPQSARAAAARLRRLVDQVDAVLGVSPLVIVAIVGGHPFALDEIERLVTERDAGVTVIGLPEDPLTAAVFAGRAGVSARRLARLPLMRSARRLAAAVQPAAVGSEP